MLAKTPVIDSKIVPEVAQEAMAAAKIRRELAELTVNSRTSSQEMATPGASSGAESVVGKRIRGKTAYTPTATPSTKTPDPKAQKVMEGTPGQAKKVLFEGA